MLYRFSSFTSLSPMIPDYQKDHSGKTKEDAEKSVLFCLGLSTNEPPPHDKTEIIIHSLTQDNKQTLEQHLNICYIMLRDKDILTKVQHPNLLIALRFRTKSILRKIFSQTISPVTEPTLEKLTEDLLYLISHKDSYNLKNYPKHARELIKHIKTPNKSFHTETMPSWTQAFNALLNSFKATPINLIQLQIAIEKMKTLNFSLDDIVFILKSVTHFSSFKIANLLLDCKYSVEDLVKISTDLLTTKGIKLAFIFYCYQPLNFSLLTPQPKKSTRTATDDECVPVGRPPPHPSSSLIARTKYSAPTTFEEVSFAEAPDIFAQRFHSEKASTQSLRGTNLTEHPHARATSELTRVNHYAKPVPYLRTGSDFADRRRPDASLTTTQPSRSFSNMDQTPISDRYGETLGYRIVTPGKLSARIIPNPTVCVPTSQQPCGAFKILTHRTLTRSGKNWGKNWEKRPQKRQDSNKKILPSDVTCLKTPPQLTPYVTLTYNQKTNLKQIKDSFNPNVNSIISRYPSFVGVFKIGERTLISKDIGLNLQTRIVKSTYTFDLKHFRLLAQNLDDAYKKYTLCHRDIKLDNVGFDGKDICLLDWDFAFVEEDNPSKSRSVVCGTPAYFSDNLFKALNLNSDNVVLYHVQDMFCFLVIVFLAYSKQVITTEQTISLLIKKDAGEELVTFIDIHIKPDSRSLVTQFLMPVGIKENTQQLHLASFTEIAKLNLDDLFLWPTSQ